MAVEVQDAVREKGRLLMLWLAAAALCIGIVLAAGRAAQLITGFVEGFRGLLRQMLF